MNRGFGFILAIPVFFIAVMFLLEVQYIQEEQRLYEEYVVNFAIDYATEAAAQELLEQTDLGVDYQDWGRINVDPNAAKDTFEAVMLLSYNFPLTQKAHEMLESSYLPLFCVAAYDGYYVYELDKNDKSLYNLWSTHKIPYGMERDDGAYFAFNLGLENLRKLDNGHLTIERVDANGFGPNDVLYYINSVVSDDLTWRFQEYLHQHAYDKNNPFVENNIIYLPMSLTRMTSVNAIKGPTVFALIDNWDLNTTHEVSAFSIGGAVLEPARMVAGYTINGQRWYCYADLLPEYGTPAFNSLNIDNLFVSVTEAAKAGYYYDPVYMG